MASRPMSRGPFNDSILCPNEVNAVLVPAVHITIGGLSLAHFVTWEYIINKHLLSPHHNNDEAQRFRGSEYAEASCSAYISLGSD